MENSNRACAADCQAPFPGTWDSESAATYQLHVACSLAPFDIPHTENPNSSGAVRDAIIVYAA
ncbi:hypothetical protein F9C07_3648 [Aspergillus flavus]|uniref:Uncharacterized protein n=1 Tax=Aspergillus flavus (strain ATCC 200026 / FGSC A1120 / IAM 13836 / NRRL 3357 / JCM 12722 / SRRC 167) TaxID=332952 RepID=A0A7U2MU04_ASPFN|nr:hypothetical protein F9C07_3648 [Aspergillus flavus]